MKIKIRLASLALAGAVLLAQHAKAQSNNPGFTYGDLMVGFQTTGAGNGSYVLANLGPASLLRDTPINLLNIINVNSALEAQFGLNWFERTDLFMGVATVGSNDEFDPIWGAGTGGVNGDPYNTSYVGAPRQAVGVAGSPESPGYLLTPAATQSSANGIYGAANIFETVGSGAVSTIGASVSFVDWNDQNPIGAGGVQGAAFDGVYAGGVQFQFTSGAFGVLSGINAQAALDLYRVQGVNNEPGQVGFGQPIGVGTFEGTVVIDSAGNLSYVAIPEPSIPSLLGVGAALVGLGRRRRALTA